MAIWENHDLVYADKPAGKGWNGMVVLRDGQKPFGWIAADNLLRGRPLEPGRKELLGLYGLIASNLILPKRYGEELERRIAEKTAELRLSEEHYRELYAGMSRDNELKERLFTILAHDLRGPVGSVKGLVDMICDQPEQFGPESLQQMMPEIRRSLGQTYGLLENLLDWIRSQLQGIEVLRKRIELGQAINTACELFTRNREEKDIRLELTVQQGLSVVSDERMLGTILRNLVSNAVKYSPAGSAIRISAATDPTGEWVIIEVADQGAGVEPGLAATLFTSNMGRGKPGTGNEKGNGLGLMFSSQLAARIGGRIELATTTGKGSTFRLILPDELDGELVPLD